MAPSANPDAPALRFADPSFRYVCVGDNGTQRVVLFHSMALEAVRRFAATISLQGKFPAVYCRDGSRWRRLN